MNVTPESARKRAAHAVAAAAALSAAMAAAVRTSEQTEGVPHLPVGTHAATITALVTREVAGPRTRIGGKYVHPLTDHGNRVCRVLVDGADAVLFEATNPMPAAPVMIHLAPGEEDPQDDLTFAPDTMACAEALTDDQAQALLECSIGEDGAYHYLTTTDETIAAELVALGLASPKHHAGEYAGVHPLTARGSDVHDYLAISPLLPVLAPSVPANDVTAFEDATAEAARLAVKVAERLNNEQAYRVATADRSDDGNDINAYLDTRSVTAPVLRALEDKGIVATQNVAVSWSSCPLRPLTRFGLLIRIALTRGRDAVLDGAHQEIAAHRRRDAHRAAADHPADCTMTFCNGEPCCWPTCPDALVNEPGEVISTPATSTPVTGKPGVGRVRRT